MRLFQRGRTRGRSADGRSGPWRGALRAALDDDLAGVADRLTEAVRNDPDDVEAFRLLGRVARERGEVRRAVGVHQALVLRRDLTPEQRLDALVELGTSLLAAGDPNRAVAAFEEVVAHDRRHVAGLRGLEAALRVQGDRPRALVVLRRRARAEGRRDRPGEARLLTEIARAAAARGDAPVARRSVARALRRDPDCADAHHLAGDLEARRGRDKPALEHWRRAVELDPARGHAILPRAAAAHARAGETPVFVEWLGRRVQRHPEDAAAWLAIGRALRDDPEPEVAVARVRRLLRGCPDRLPGLTALGDVVVHAGHGRNVTETVKAYAELVEAVAARLSGAAPPDAPDEPATPRANGEGA